MAQARRIVLTTACILAALVAGIAGVLLLSWLVPSRNPTGHYFVFLAANGGLAAAALAFFTACKIGLGRILNWKLNIAVYVAIVFASDPLLSWLYNSLNIGAGVLVLSWIATVLGSGLTLLYLAPTAQEEGINDQTV